MERDADDCALTESNLDMTTITSGPLEDRYFTRMDAALGDKLRILQWLPENVDSIVDMGAGSGALAAAMSRRTGASVYALDSNPDSIMRMRDAGVDETVTVAQGSFTQLEAMGRTVSVDAVVCSSVLHEVYSYGGRTTTERYAAWREAIVAAVSSLRVGGRLIIRDGVAPRYPLRRASIRPLTRSDDRVLRRYLASLPDDSPRHLRERDGVYEHTAIAVAEALFTLNWLDADPDPQQLEREAAESYLLADLNGMIQRVTRASGAAGLKVQALFAQEYIQPEYVRHLRGRYSTLIQPLEQHDSLEPWFPSTNALWVFERQ